VCVNYGDKWQMGGGHSPINRDIWGSWAISVLRKRVCEVVEEACNHKDGGGLVEVWVAEVYNQIFVRVLVSAPAVLLAPGASCEAS